MGVVKTSFITGFWAHLEKGQKVKKTKKQTINVPFPNPVDAWFGMFIILEYNTPFQIPKYSMLMYGLFTYIYSINQWTKKGR